MVFSTKALPSKNSIFSSFHQPVYIDRKTSQKILDSLVSSFNRNLEREHGPLPGSPFPSASRRPPGAGLEGPKPAKPHPQPVDTHLGAILSNPLFNYNKKSPSKWKYPLLGVAGPGQDGGPAGKKGEATGGKKDDWVNRREPMDVFDEAVSKGLMTIPRATGCLVAERKMLGASTPSRSIAKAMALSGAGTRVVRWLRSSGADRSLSFVKFAPRKVPNDPTTTAFLDNLFPFLLAEGAESIIWTWFSRVLRDKTSGSQSQSEQHINASGLVIALIRAHWNLLSQEHHIPYDVVLETEQRYADASPAGASADAGRGGANLGVNPVFRAWKYVSFYGTMSKVLLPPPPARVFDRFVALADRWGASAEADRAHLDLHHPMHPTPDRAVRYISQEKPFDAAQAKRSASFNGKLMPHLGRVVQMGVDAINYFVARGEKAEAAHVYTLLTQIFPWVPWNEFLNLDAEVFSL